MAHRILNLQDERAERLCAFNILRGLHPAIRGTMISA